MRPITSLPLTDYALEDARELLTPALVVYPKWIQHNIDEMLRLCGGKPDRWRPHVKTNKLPRTVEMLLASGVRNFKCANTLELLTLGAVSVPDVLLAYAQMGRNTTRVLSLAEQLLRTRVSCLVEHIDQVEQWRGGKVGLFIDVNGGMNRTGIEQHRVDDIVAMARAIVAAGIEFRGVHYYDGHHGSVPHAQREAPVHAGYAQLMRICAALTAAGLAPEEVITSGTPAFPYALTYAPFDSAPFVHRVSPGTIVYSDMMVADSLPETCDFRPAALVLAHVLSHPAPGRITLNAGSKGVSADIAGQTGTVLGLGPADYARPSEEHLPIQLPDGAPLPALGEVLYVVPRHVCTTVNLHGFVIIAEGGRARAVERISARGHEAPR
jgi:D-serine deaminase-like pyridoxal phosphate-dependent protein